jgi:hypothetical protein
MKLFSNLTPLIPLSFARRGGRDLREEFHPSLSTLPIPVIRGGAGGQIADDLSMWS